MAIAFDAFTSNTGGTGDYSFTHTPVGTPRGVLVHVLMNGANIGVSGVTYGGVAMVEASSSPASNLTGELGAAHCFFLGSTVSSGAQTVSVDVTLGTEVSCAGCTTVTADQDTSIVAQGTVVSDNQSDPAVTLGLGGITCFAMLGAWTGIGNLTMAATAGWTERFEFDFGNQNALVYTYDTIGSTDVLAKYLQAADDVAMHAIAIRENAVAGATEQQPADFVFMMA